MLNKVMIIGRLGQDPQLKYSNQGSPICTFTVATDESYTDRDGNKVERTEWHRIVVYQKLAETCNNYLSKGRQVYVEGSLQTRKWQDQQGQDRYTTEIKAQRVQFLGSRTDSRPQGEGEWGASPQRSQQGGVPKRAAPQQHPDDDMGPAFPSEAASMDDVPF